MIKAGGSDDGFYTDSQFYQNRDQARRLGIPRGFYYYAGGGNPVQEAQHFVSIVGPLQPGEVVAMDLEVDVPDPVTYALQFLKQSGQLFGVKPLLYTNMNRVLNYNWAPVAGSGYQLWEADYDGDPAAVPASGSWPGPAIKQYSDGGMLAGMNGNTVDLNVLEGAEPLELLGKSSSPPAPPPKASGSKTGQTRPQKASAKAGSKHSASAPAKKSAAPKDDLLQLGGEESSGGSAAKPLEFERPESVRSGRC